MNNSLNRRPRTRLQAQREAEQIGNESSNTRQLIQGYMQEFREEISNMLTEGIRHITLASQASRLQGGPNPNGEPSAAQHLEQNIRGNRRNNGPNVFNEQDNMNRNFNQNSERILNLIRNWRIHFTGNSTGISVEEFIYRINTLTIANLNGNFDILCEHAHILFEGKALTWFWRYHRSCDAIYWDALCEALKKQFKDYKTDFDIKDDILHHKQKQNETFDEFYDAIMLFCDKLKIPLTECELCETVQRNLRPEVRHEILHLEFTRVSQLRHAVHKHEKFIRDTSAFSNTKYQNQKPRIAEVQGDNMNSDSDNEMPEETEICLLVKRGTCWNCDSVGHSFIDCLEPRTIFCYGCGAKNTYKPKCTYCARKQENSLRDVRTRKDGHPKCK